jgi:uncharacterized protein
MGQLEQRYFEVRAAADAPQIEGYAIVFDQRSQDLGGFVEIVSKDAKIDFADVRALFNHDENFVLGRVSSGTLQLTRDAHGIKMVNTPPETQWAKDLLVSMRRGDINQQSFKFQVAPQGAIWEERDGVLIRTVERFKVFDVSVVTTPAYEGTDAQVRSAAEILAERPQARGPEPLPWNVDLEHFERRAALLGKMTGAR